MFTPAAIIRLQKQGVLIISVGLKRIVPGSTGKTGKITWG